jgi:hypothetical protein
MLDDVDKGAPGFDPPGPDRVYQDYLQTCEMLGVKPVSRGRALGLIQEWTEVLSGPPGIPPVSRTLQMMRNWQ